ncbi:ABC transporter permease [Caldilinea sp.]|jgi:peptide/nickel transport system permease protein|uniref:ABC transporter permease n=1 Tax=Caldilinea sp. TaxID=2293560 RepID=UPI0021DCEEFF|nr:ABC transporter permease [Caldilinea sp.]GIV68752.1 MAG: glutathione ABC transporter permease [Caldilinea sp.]
MGRYVAVRLFHGVIVIFLISLLTFVVMRMMPGDPVYLLLGEGQVRISEDQIQAIRARWGLDRSYPEQYLIWMGNLLTGNFGESIIRTGVPVRDMIFEAIPVTAQLNLYSMALALLFSVPMGIWAAVKRNSIVDYSSSVISVVGVATPNFWLSLMLIIVFSLMLRWLPPFGLKSWQGFILPVIVLAVEQMAVFTRVMRSSTIEALKQDYVRTATAKGLSRRAVILNHAVRNALLPLVTVIGFNIAFLLSGTIVVETIFALPGVGRLFTDSVFRLDYQVVQSLVVILAVLVVVANLLTDLVYAFIDPRIRLSR